EEVLEDTNGVEERAYRVVVPTLDRAARRTPEGEELRRNARLAHDRHRGRDPGREREVLHHPRLQRFGEGLLERRDAERERISLAAPRGRRGRGELPQRSVHVADDGGRGRGGCVAVGGPSGEGGTGGGPGFGARPASGKRVRAAGRPATCNVQPVQYPAQRSDPLVRAVGQPDVVQIDR